MECFTIESGEAAVVGSITYTAAAPFTNIATIMIIDRDQIVMSFPTAPHVQRLLKLPEILRDPVDNDIIEEHLIYPLEEGYIAVLERAIEERFEIDVCGVWATAYGYMPIEGEFFRSYVLHPEQGNLSAGEFAELIRGWATGPLKSLWHLTVDKAE